MNETMKPPSQSSQTQPSQYLPHHPSEFIGKSRRIAKLLFKKAESIKLNGGSARWLFTGPPGSAKSRLAQVLANDLAHHPTAIEQLNGQSLSVDLVREWERQGHYKPIIGHRYVRLVDEVDCASTGALNELRTYLDRLKDGTVFIATTNKAVKDLPAQLQSRMFVYQFEPVGSEEFADFMVRNFQFDWQEAFDIAQRNEGCVRSALIDSESAMDGKAMA